MSLIGRSWCFLVAVTLIVAGCLRPGAGLDNETGDALTPDLGSGFDPDDVRGVEGAPSPGDDHWAMIPTEPELTAPAVIRFIVFGDQGTGEPPQYRVGEAMAAVCEARGCDFVIGTGDNVYDLGVRNPYDPQFETKFEAPYRDLDVPFYMSLGNHDYGRTPTSVSYWSDGNIEDRAQHQVAYHYRTDRTSEKWQMPARTYAFTAGDARFVALDTSALLITDEQARRLNAATRAEQKAFVEEAFAAGDTTWRFAFGHNPYLSNGHHGGLAGFTGPMAELPQAPAAKAWFEDVICDKVDVYFQGHDHDLQWLHPIDECGKTHFLVSGAAARPRPMHDRGNPALFEIGRTLGFWYVHVEGDELRATAFDADARALFEGFMVRS